MKRIGKAVIALLVSASVMFPPGQAFAVDQKAGAIAAAGGSDEMALTSTATAQQNESDYASSQVIVVMDAPAPVPLGKSMMPLSAPSAQDIETIAENTYLLTEPTPHDALRLAREMEGQPGVVHVQPNYVYGLPGEELVNDAVASSLNVPSDVRISDQWYVDGLGLDDAWDMLHTDKTVSVAVLDSPVNTRHEDLTGALDLVHSWDAAAGGPLGAQGWTHDHGTRVASIVGAVGDNGKGICGASFGANVVAVNVFTNQSRPTATTASLVRGLEYVIDLAEREPELNLKVINLSVGGYAQLRSEGYDALLKDSLEEAAYEHDMAVVCAAGNGSTSEFLWPSDWDCSISVTATNEDLQTKAWFSDFNNYKDIAAPGVNMYGADANGTNTYSADDGTSFAAPVVSGVLALMFAADPGLTRQEATDILYETAKDIGSPGRDPEFGNGLVSADKAVARALVESDCASMRFKDVDQNAWYQQPVGYLDFAVSQGLMKGSDGLLRPMDNVTRAEAVNVLWRAYDPNGVREFASGDQSLTADFKDAQPGAWYVGGLNWAYDMEVTKGIGNGVFGIDGPVTVEQYCTFLARIMATDAELASVDFSSLAPFVDASDVSSYARESVAWCLSKGYTKGVLSDGKLFIEPKESLSRARMAGLLYNVCQMEGGFFTA